MWLGAAALGLQEFVLTLARKLLIRRVHSAPTLTLMISRQTHQRPDPTKRPLLKAAASWLSLVAATTAGMGPTATVRTRVRADVTDEVGELRLVIHSYRPEQLGTRTLPDAADRPVASAQRAVTADELRRGVSVDMLHPVEGGAENARPLLVAWVERGRANLDFDALLARPLPGVLRGCAKAQGRADTMHATVDLTAA
jgi:hypothetical protein